jgi:Na+/H+ antiporter NhaC
VVNVSVGAVISIALLGAGVAVVASAPWLSVILCGPSLLALAKVFVLHRSDPDDMKLLSRASNNATNAAPQPPPPQQPPAP